MKILHLEASPGWGGQEIRILEEAKGMRSRGHEVILGVQKGGGLVSRAKEAGFLVYEISFTKKRSLFVLFKILILLWKHKIDLINTHSSLDAWIGGLAGKLLRRPIVRTRHLSTAIRKGLNSFLLYNLLADRVVTTSEETAGVLREQASLNTKRCLSIPTGVDPKKIVVKKAEKSNPECVVGTLCVIRGWKGLSDFLHAAKLLEDIPNLKWKIIGGGVSEDHFKAECKSLNLEDKVTFTGHLENPFDDLASLDIFLLLSYAHEGVSQASLQAAWLKKPLVTTRTGGLKEVCIDQVTGFQVDTHSPKQVADAVIKLMNAPELRKKMGEKAHKLVSEHFTFEKTLDGMESVYRSLLKSS